MKNIQYMYKSTGLTTHYSLRSHGNPHHEAPSAFFVLMLIPEEVWSVAVTESGEQWQILWNTSPSKPAL